MRRENDPMFLPRDRRAMEGKLWEMLGINVREGWGPPGRVTSAVLTLLVSLLAAVLLQISFSGQAQALEDIPDSGTWHVTGGRVESSVLSGDGKTLYIGGDFDRVYEKAPGTGGASFAAPGLAAIDVQTGAALRSWTPRVSGGENMVYSLAVANGSVFVGGNFTTVNGQTRGDLAEVDANDGSLKPFAPNISAGAGDTIVRTVATGAGRLYVGGQFSRVNGNLRGNLAAFNLSNGGLDGQWTPQAAGPVRELAMATDGATIFATGDFYEARGSDDSSLSPRRNVARFEANSGALDPWYIPGNILGEGSYEQSGWVLLPTENRLYAGFGNKGPNYIKSFRLDSGDRAEQEWSFSTVGDPYALALSPDGTRLFAGGHFGTVRLEQNTCGTKVRGAISLNPANGQPRCDWIPKLDLYDKTQWNGHAANTMQIIDNYLWLGGRFYTVSDVEQRSLARFTIVQPPEPVPPPEPVSELNVNFQTADAAVPGGYIKDFGEPFGSRRRDDQGTGLYYGWVEPGTSTPLSLTEDGRERASLSSNQRLATFMHMQKSAQGAWEMSIPDGTYEVTVSVGDNDYADSTHNVNVEGQNLIDNAALTNDNKFANATGTFEVTDGRLTVDAVGGQNTKINYIDITNADASLSSNQENLDFGNAGLGGSAKIRNVVLENTGNSNINVQDIQIAGTDSDVFSLESLSGDTTLEPGGTLTVEVGFRPERTGSKEATLTVTHSGDNQPIKVGLSGSGVPNGQGCTVIGTANADEIRGTEGDDVICAYGGPDVVRGLGGNDELRGQAGNDELYGGEGDDLLIGGPGNDLLDGGSGNNTLQQ
jgi:Ca2+-binding RTX toxin-like protein